MTPEEYFEMEPNFKYKLDVSMDTITSESFKDIIDVIGPCLISTKRDSTSYYCYEGAKDVSLINEALSAAKFNNINPKAARMLWKYVGYGNELAERRNHLYFLIKEDMVLAKLLLEMVVECLPKNI